MKPRDDVVAGLRASVTPGPTSTHLAGTFVAADDRELLEPSSSAISGGMTMSPVTRCSSEWQSPEAASLTRTSPCLGRVERRCPRRSSRCAAPTGSRPGCPSQFPFERVAGLGGCPDRWLNVSGIPAADPSEHDVSSGSWEGISPLWAASAGEHRKEAPERPFAPAAGPHAGAVGGIVEQPQRGPADRVDRRALAHPADRRRDDDDQGGDPASAAGPEARDREDRPPRTAQRLRGGLSAVGVAERRQADAPHAGRPARQPASGPA